MHTHLVRDTCAVCPRLPKGNDPDGLKLTPRVSGRDERIDSDTSMEIWDGTRHLYGGLALLFDYISVYLRLYYEGISEESGVFRHL